MKIAIIQFEPKFKDKKFNLKLMRDYINKIDTDLIIFPELATSGYYFQSKSETINFSLKIDSKEMDDLREISNNLNKAICFGFPELDNDHIYNSAALIIPNSDKINIYRKTHLFFKERYVFSEGNLGFNNFYWKEKDLNIGLMICYDWRFPESARTLSLKGADLILCPSNLVTDVWHISMPSRALENKVYLAVANRIGSEEFKNEKLLFKGESAIWNYNGKLIQKASLEKEEVIYADIFPEMTRNKSFNSENDIFNDRRSQYYL